MILLLLLILPVAEIWLIFRVGSQIGAFNTFMWLLVMLIFGSGLARAQGRQIIAKAQAQLARGEAPSGATLHGILVFFGGILFLLPGFISDIVGVFFVVPGFRHLIALYAQRRWTQQIRAGRFRVFTATGGFGGMGAGFPGGGPFGRGPFGSAGWPDDPTEAQRDVTPKVIDVTPVRSSRTDDGDDGKTEG